VQTVITESTSEACSDSESDYSYIAPDGGDVGVLRGGGRDGGGGVEEGRGGGERGRGESRRGDGVEENGKVPEAGRHLLQGIYVNTSRTLFVTNSACAWVTQSLWVANWSACELVMVMIW